MWRWQLCPNLWCTVPISHNLNPKSHLYAQHISLIRYHNNTQLQIQCHNKHNCKRQTPNPKCQTRNANHCTYLEVVVIGFDRDGIKALWGDVHKLLQFAEEVSTVGKRLVDCRETVVRDAVADRRNRWHLTWCQNGHAARRGRLAVHTPDRQTDRQTKRKQRRKCIWALRGKISGIRSGQWCLRRQIQYKY